MKCYIFVSLFFTLSKLFSFAEEIGSVVCYVNKDVITNSDVSMLAKETGLTNEQALDRLIDQCVLLQDFNDKKGRIPVAQLDVQMDNIVQESFKGNRNALSQVLKMKGQTFFGLKEEIKTSIILNVMRQQKSRSIHSISPRKIREYYNSHIEEFTIPTFYTIEQSGFNATSKITIDGVEKNKKDVLKEHLMHKSPLEAIKKQLDEFVNDPIEYKAEELDNCLVECLEKLAIGATTDYLKINNVYVCSKLLGKKPARVKLLEEVQAEIEEKLLIEINQKNYQAYVDSLKAKASIRIVK